MGETLTGMIKQQTSSKASADGPAIEWVHVNTEKEAMSGLDEQKYYAALVVPADFSQNQATLLTEKPVQPQLRIYVNQRHERFGFHHGRSGAEPNRRHDECEDPR